ncbi:MAG: aminotransferase class V-fold PLP-dependent enzyme [Alphaproteobacteria bacterium]|jgi:alanine-glyoxylate transaminase/serine-glyoxylate transaminase/serine-pyruvate transaminase|nr:aminotransferase class V-fold PLP-dependent enzyme [Alphaproteobacteria bacterium]
MSVVRGRQFLAIPGPTNIPDRILRAMDRPTVDFKSTAFQPVMDEAFAGLKKVFQTESTIFAYASAGKGAWESAMANTLSPGDKILIGETGAFSDYWREAAKGLQLETEMLPGDWRHGVDPDAVEARLREDTGREIKAVCVVHNETATGVASRLAEIRQAIDAAGHPALYMVDTISSLASIDFRMDAWGVDLTVAGSQKGLMLPSGLSFLGASEKALQAAQSARMPRSYWDWSNLYEADGSLRFPSTAPVHLIYGLAEALNMLLEEGLDQVFARHHRLAEAVRRCVKAWSEDGGPELFSLDAREHSNSVSTILLPEGHDAEALRRTSEHRFGLALGAGLERLHGRAFRFAHMGDLNEPMVLGGLAALEMSLAVNDIPFARGGLQAAVDYLAAS